MKIKILFLLSISCMFFAKAQDNNKTCLEKIEKLETLIKENKFDIASNDWKSINKNCKNTNEDFFRNGEKIFLNNLEFVNSDEEKKIVITDLIQLYDQYDNKFPENKNGNGLKKALYLYENKLGTNDEVFAILDFQFKKNKPEFNNSRLLYVYYFLLVEQYKQGNKQVTFDDLYSRNLEINQKIVTNITEFNQKIAALKAKENLQVLSASENNQQKEFQNQILSLQTVDSGNQSMFAPYITCENLTSFSKNKFDENQNNVFWMNYIFKKMYEKNCFSDPIFEKILTKLHDLNPSVKTFYYLGYLSIIKNDQTKAINYFNESANKASDKTEKANIYYTIATLIYGANDPINANVYIQKALESDPTFAMGYLFLSNLYEVSINQCAKTDFEKKAMYWLIAETIKKAGLANPSYLAAAQKQAADYLTKAPTNSEIAKSGKSGKKITFKCWINQTIEVPKI